MPEQYAARLEYAKQNMRLIEQNSNLLALELRVRRAIEEYLFTLPMKATGS